MAIAGDTTDTGEHIYRAVKGFVASKSTCDLLSMSSGSSPLSSGSSPHVVWFFSSCRLVLLPMSSGSSPKFECLP